MPKIAKEVIAFNGLGSSENVIHSLGHILINILSAQHRFHLIPDLDFPYDGIIGNDFLSAFNSQIDYSKEILTLGDLSFKLQFHEPTLIIPARSEVVVECSISNPELKEGLILDQNISDDLLVANCLVKTKANNRANITVVNISESDITLRNNLKLRLDPIDTIPNHHHTKSNIINYTNSNETNSIQRTNQVLSMLRTSHLNNEETSALLELCTDYSDIFHLPNEKLTYTNAIQHDIKTTSEVPIHTKTYRFPEIHKKEVDKQINDMLEQGIIEPSISPWSSPIWVVPKKLDASGQQKWRIVIDYRKLNDITIGDTYPIPQITEILDQLGKSTYFSTLDLASGFHQILVNQPEKTAFSVPQGHFQFARMSFGLKNAPSTFQRLMNTALSGLQGLRCFVYLDDIVCYSSDLKTQIQNLAEIFQRLRNFNLKLQPDKCEFLRREVAYLGHIISTDGVKPNPDKIKAVVEFPTPSNPKDIKSFLGLVSYYRRFIPDFSKIAKPLTSLLKKETPFNWENQQQISFDLLKQKLTTAPVLAYPDFSQPFLLTCDASNHAVGSVLSQGPVGKDRPIAFASRTLNRSEVHYSTTEKELLAILFGCKTFRPYLYGRKFQIITDHRPLKWLFNHKDPSSKMQRWRLKLEEFDYEIIYRKGKLNSAADALSRYPVNPIIPSESSDETLNPEPLSPDENHDNLPFSPITLEDLTVNLPAISDQDSNELPCIDLLEQDNDILLQSKSAESSESANPTNPTNSNDIPNPIDHEPLPTTATPLTPQSPNSNPDNILEDDYSKFLKEINKNTTFNTKVIDQNQNLLKTHCQTILVPTSIDMDESNPYVPEIMETLSNPDETLYREKQLYSFEEVPFGNKVTYLMFVKVHHFDDCSYPEIFQTLKTTRNHLITLNPPITEIAIPDFKNPFESHSFAKIYNILVYIFHNTNIIVNIYHNSIIYPSLSEIKKILKENHDIPIAGHLGGNRMLSRIKEKYYWKGIKSDVENYIKNCTLCQENKALRRCNRAPMQITTTSTSPFQRVSLDIVGPLPESGTAKLKYVMTLQDDLTKYSAAYPLRSVSAEETTDCLIHFISLFGIPNTIFTDQGTNFTSDLFKSTCSFLKIKNLWSTPYHPQSQGALERSHSTLKEYLKSFVNDNQDDWPRYVYTAMLSYNTAIHSTTNFSPYELLFGHKAFIPDSIYKQDLTTYPDYVRMLQHRLKQSWAKAAENIDKSKDRSKSYYDNKTRPIKYKVGDFVYLKNHLRLRKALSPIWKGPYKVIQVHNNNNVTLLINRRHVRHHFDEIKLASATPSN
ncbi:uncharacterized protein LOC119629252 [Bombyx mori]|uniref:RNA-directed DNA polymerase n=1 Tax=Bombyx mori TaxID=7091 RepID=A0A8R2QW84_BOMMO|nr:uncharacterized protein LOC119629252 [Bombyx mori]